MLRRSGFGATGPEVDSAVAVGDPSVVVAEILDGNFRKDPGVIATPMPDLEIPHRPHLDAVAERRRYRTKLTEQRNELTQWWVRRMVAIDNPISEKLTFLWHNHFATSAEKVIIPRLLARQNEKLRSHCLGNFRTLAGAMLSDPAMIVWLDGRENKVGSPNENLSREFMELFALGHGNGYSEADVREGARALTGWALTKDGGAELLRKRHDDATKTVLDTTGEIDAKELCDIVVAEPASARYIAGRLWQQLASDEPPSTSTSERLIEAYGPSYDLKALTNAILTDPTFLGSTGTVVSPPLDWLIGTLRALRVELDKPDQIKQAVTVLESLGQLPFYPPNVGGWPRGRAWLSSSAANVRLQTANKVVQDGDLSVVADSAVADRIDAAGYMIGIGAWSDRTVEALKPLRKHPDALVAAAVNTPEYLTS
ncbi:DUF1800 domain-containing protein [Mycolicibacterium hippocampi]|uniref:DUF1800 domain-containing protein n=1 Tax=Mycolicibacterium hippocampi TaxID=659824 RepID=UPI0027E39CA9|nr:DUF1800 domain-containing protein [Mycolicibacterium hippocampi]